MSLDVIGALILALGAGLGVWAVLEAMADGTFRDAPPPDPRDRVILSGDDTVSR